MFSSSEKKSDFEETNDIERYHSMVKFKNQLKKVMEPSVKIYVLHHTKTWEFFYVGSTHQDINKRRSEHKIACNRNPDRKIYKYINRKTKNDFSKVGIMCVHIFPGNPSKLDVLIMERKFSDMYGTYSKCNKNIQGKYLEMGHKNYFKEYCRKIHTCEDCGRQYTGTNVSNHRRTKKHIKLTQNLISDSDSESESD